ncbi:MAG TPA: DUF1697 domain-containing protein [Bryobacteraceae bacterium]|jgi:uncharacterized protein (DUF1697 family)|nr:DUF1697 domain-containing protein [Bryobacteraceae bacterium]
MPAKYLALFRGVNVGGSNKLPMKELAVIFTASGCRDVQTYIQSGNVVFNAPAKIAAQASVTIARKVRDRFGFEVPIVMRTAEEVGAVLSANPFLAQGAAENTLHVSFLADLPAPSNVQQLDPNRSVGDMFVVVGREIYMQLPNGMARTKLTSQYFDSRLKTVGTVRNWRTVQQLCILMRAAP